MKKISLVCGLFAVLAFVGCKNEKKDAENMDTMNDTIQVDKESEPEITKSISVTMEPKSKSTAQGEVYFSEANGVVSLEAKFSGLTPGTHAIHLHEKADCSAADATSSGGHWNPTHSKHGKWGDADGYHKGDIGNFEVGDDGTGKVTMLTDQWCIGCGDETKDIIGKAVIVHEGQDDFKTQPTGDAGGRVACGGIIK
ncbi:superoxide dismutase family protein [Aequorivita sp. F47161]|uniref:Superoxide dismutase [Cu-Zn] n=1 Tax=Aequorivita vitellina TaxID=2874475 RepID=A0A9X1U384_9FLAO|nr:superoxide dismutase family protein [Aequorivita vitellina]MCG2419012.1 superoxide dismutase family protein [Aequorivita vitellina]MCZ4318446.1 superoxide dismutase family protein [Aequorivita viscosa]